MLHSFTVFAELPVKSIVPNHQIMLSNNCLVNQTVQLLWILVFTTFTIKSSINTFFSLPMKKFYYKRSPSQVVCHVLVKLYGFFSLGLSYDFRLCEVCPQNSNFLKLKVALDYPFILPLLPTVYIFFPTPSYCLWFED